MSLDATAMSNAMTAAINTSGGDPANSLAKISEFCLAISTAIVAYLPTVWQSDQGQLWYDAHPHTTVGVVGSTLASSMKTNVGNTGFFTHVAGKSYWQEFCDALGNGIADYMNTEASLYVSNFGWPHTHTLQFTGSTLDFTYIRPLLVDFVVGSPYSWMPVILGGICSGFCSHVNSSTTMSFFFVGAGPYHYHTHS